MTGSSLDRPLTTKHYPEQELQPPPPPPTKLFGCKQAGRLLWGEIHQSYCRGVTNRNTGGPLAHKRFTDSSWDLHQGFLGKRVCRTVCPLWINGSNRMKERQYRDSKTPVMSNFYFKGHKKQKIRTWVPPILQHWPASQCFQTWAVCLDISVCKWFILCRFKR